MGFVAATVGLVENKSLAPIVCRILVSNQGSNSHPLHWKTDFNPPDHQGSLKPYLIFPINVQGRHCPPNCMRSQAQGCWMSRLRSPRKETQRSESLSLDNKAWLSGFLLILLGLLSTTILLKHQFHKN